MNRPTKPPVLLPPHDSATAASDFLRESSTSAEAHSAATLARCVLADVTRSFAMSKKENG